MATKGIPLADEFMDFNWSRIFAASLICSFVVFGANNFLRMYIEVLSLDIVIVLMMGRRAPSECLGCRSECKTSKWLCSGGIYPPVYLPVSNRINMVQRLPR